MLAIFAKLHILDVCGRPGYVSGISYSFAYDFYPIAGTKFLILWENFQCKSSRRNVGVTDFSIDCFTLEFNVLKLDVTFLYPLKTRENQRFSDVYRGLKNGTLG